MYSVLVLDRYFLKIFLIDKFEYIVVLGWPPKLSRALGKSSVQNSSPYQVLQPHWQDRKENDLKQNCAAAYAGTCQAHIQCTVAIENRCTRKCRYIHLTRRLKKTFYFRKSGANWGVLAIPRPHMHRKHVLLLKCHQLVISELSIFWLECSDWRPQRLKARASHHYLELSLEQEYVRSKLEWEMGNTEQIPTYTSSWNILWVKLHYSHY